MADGVQLDLMTGGSIVATDDIGGTHHQYVKMEYGADGTAFPVSSVNPLPTSLASGTVAINAGTIDVISNLTNGSIVVTTGTVNKVNNAGTIAGGTIGQLTTGSIVVTAGTVQATLASPGTITSGTVSVNTPGTITSGTISVNTPGTITSGTVSINAGTIGTVTNVGQVYNAGTIQNGTLAAVTTVANITNGTIRVTAGTEVITSGSIAVTAGTVQATLASPGTITSGTVSINAGTVQATLASPGTITSGSIVVTAGTTKISDGTNIVNVANIGTGSLGTASQSAILVAGAFREITGAGTATGSVIGPVDVSNYKSVSVHSLNSFSASIEFQVSNNNSTWERLALVDTSSPINISTGNGGGEEMKSGNLQAARYFRVQCTSYSSGTINLVVELHTEPISTPVQTGGVDMYIKGYEISGVGDKEIRATAAHITTSTTTTPTSSDAWVTSITIMVITAGTTSTITVQDKGGTPKKLVNLFSTAALSTTGPLVLNFQTPVLMSSGIDIITAGATPATVDVFTNYVQ